MPFSEFGEILLVLASTTARVSSPLILAAMAGILAERSGIVDISLEGKMLISAFFAAAIAADTGSAWIGLMAGCAASLTFALIHGFACITHRGNQVVSGVALNILAAGLAITLALNWYQMGGLTPKLEGDARFTPITLWVAEALAGIPLIGPIYASTLSGHSALVYMAFIAVPITWFLLFQTRFGLRLRAVGENPSALDVAGLSVDRMRYLALIAGSVFCGLAGTYLAVAANAGFVRDMTAGRGFIALAAVIFGKWMPGKVLIACLLFGALDGIAILLQGVEIAGLGQVPVQLIEALPYGLTIVLLAGLVGKSVPPQSIGIPYVKDR